MVQEIISLGKTKKREYGRDRYRNISKEDKQKVKKHPKNHWKKTLIEKIETIFCITETDHGRLLDYQCYLLGRVHFLRFSSSTVWHENTDLERLREGKRDLESVG